MEHGGCPTISTAWESVMAQECAEALSRAVALYRTAAQAVAPSLPLDLVPLAEWHFVALREVARSQIRR